MAHQNYDHSEFISVRYYQGTYGCTASTYRAGTYYGFSGTPTLWFNGTHKIVGAGSSAATGEGYMGIIKGRYFDPSPIQVEIDSFNSTTGAASVTVTMHSTTASLVNEDFHIILIEDDPTVQTEPATHVTRAMYDDTITLTGAGNTATFTTTFTIDPAWITNNLWVAAVVQNQSQEMIQAASSIPVPDYHLRAMVPFSRTALGPSDSGHEFDAFTVINTGLGDNFEVSIVIDDAPAGWTVAFKDEAGTTHTDPLLFGLAADASTTFKAIVVPSSPGFMRCHLEFTSPNLTRPLEVPFVYITDDVDVLIVDDDGGDAYEDYFREALDTAGKSYGVWDLSSDPLTTEVADTFTVLVWNVGFAFPTLDTTDKAFIAAFLDSGKGIFLSGQDIGWDLNANDPDPVWYHTYLHANYIRDDTNIMSLDGVPGDVITDGLDLYIAGGTGANNQEYPDEIAAADADATEILHYTGGFCGAIRSTDSVTGAQVVYLGFGFEGIDNAQDRHDLLVPSVRWLQGIAFEDDFESGNTNAWSNTVP